MAWLVLNVPFIELQQLGRHVPVGVHHVHEHHVSVPEALPLQGCVLLPQRGGVALHPGPSALQEPQQAVLI